jgi:hypothetical protein
MNIIKEFYCEAYDQLVAEAEERGEFPSGEKLRNLAAKRANDMLYDMCDEAKDRAKYSKLSLSDRGLI